MTKGKKVKKTNNNQQTITPNTNKKEEDVEKQVQNNSSDINVNIDENSKKLETSETNPTPVANVPINSEIFVELKTSECKKENSLEDKNQEKRTALDNAKLGNEAIIKSNKNEIKTVDIQKEKVCNDQNVVEQKPEKVITEKESILQNKKDQIMGKGSSLEPLLDKKPQEVVKIPNISQSDANQTKNEAKTKANNEEIVKTETDTLETQDQTEKKSEEGSVDNKGQENIKKGENISHGDLVGTTEMEKNNVNKAVSNDGKTNDRKRKDRKGNENLKSKTETEHKCKNDHKQKKDSNSKNIEKPPQSTTCSQNTNNIAGYEFREHMNGQNVTEFFNDCQSSNEKFKIICDKYSELYSDFKVLHLLAKKQEKQIELMQNEKEILEVEVAKQNSSREKLEQLCRELQKQNRAIREDNLQIIRDEEEKRKSIALKFEKTFKEISTKVQESNDKTNNLRDDNLDLTVKFRDLLIECDRKDQELFDYREKCAEMLKIEENLRNQISMYTEKYEGFQHTLSRSNEIFAGFKSEMEIMSKKINNLESETATWKQRWENSHKAYLDVLNQKTHSETELLSTSRQLAALLKLCRTLQTERAAMLTKLNGPGASITTGIEDATNQETIEETLRQIVKNVPESLKSSTEQANNAISSEKDRTKKQTPAENKENSSTESSKPANKKSIPKK